jgi:hypothetical protein
MGGASLGKGLRAWRTHIALAYLLVGCAGASGASPSSCWARGRLGWSSFLFWLGCLVDQLLPMLVLLLLAHGRAFLLRSILLQSEPMWPPSRLIEADADRQDSASQHFRKQKSHLSSVCPKEGATQTMSLSDTQTVSDMQIVRSDTQTVSANANCE